jgi:hypothetical protein
VAELGRGVAPINGLKTEEIFSDSMLAKGGMRVPWGGTPGPSDPRRVGGFVGEPLLGVLVRSE